MPEQWPAADDFGFQLLYREGPCLIVNKPGGLLTQSPPDIDSLEHRIKRYLAAVEGKTGRVYLGVPHRLDRPASGALAFARHARAARRISEQFERRLVRKTYWAVVSGRPPEPEGEWRDYMRKLPGQAAADIVEADHPDARQAVLRYRVLQQDKAMTWLEIELETGRTHQIRVQAAHRGLPLLGDEQYGSSSLFGEPQHDPRRRWIALHARRLAFNHPMSREPLDVTAPLPKCWRDLPLAFPDDDGSMRVPGDAPDDACDDACDDVSQNA